MNILSKNMIVLYMNIKLFKDHPKNIYKSFLSIFLCKNRIFFLIRNKNTNF